MNQKIILFISLILFTFWLVRLNYKIFDKELKKYILVIASLLILFIVLKIFRIYYEISFIWYLYYIPLIFTTSLYYLCSKYLLIKDTKNIKCLILTISTILLFLVLTNDYHSLVFIIRDSNNYTHNVIYFIIVIYIFSLLIFATFNLIKVKKCSNKDIKKYTPLIPILLGLIYTILYVINIPIFIRKTNMVIIMCALFYIGLEDILKMKLIPNNNKYVKVFKNSYLPIKIINRNGKTIYETNKSLNIPSVIKRDIFNNNIKENYTFNYKHYEILSFHNSFSILEKDYLNITNLRKDLKAKNKELLHQEKILMKTKEIKDKLYSIKIYNDVMIDLENKINKKKIQINKIIMENGKSNKDKLEEIKTLISYSKRMSYLIISNYNKEEYNKEKILVILNELLMDFKIKNISAYFNILNSINLNSKQVIDIYDIIFNIFNNINNTSLLINLNNNTMNILFPKKIDDLKLVVNKKHNMTVKTNESETSIFIRIGE